MGWDTIKKKEEAKPNEVVPHKAPDVSRETQPQQTGNRQIDHSAAAAQARQTFKTPHDMTYATPNSTLVGKEQMTANGTPILQTNDGQLYKGTLNDKGNITQWQPIKPDGTDNGKPIQVTSERTGAPPAGVRPEQYVAAPKQTENLKAPENKSDAKQSDARPEPTRSEQPKSESKFEYPKPEQHKSAVEAQKELYESHKQNFDPQKQILERAAQQLANPVSVQQEKPEVKTTKVDHISVTPQPEFQRASNPFNIFAQKLERTIANAPNTVEFGQKFVNYRDSRDFLRPSSENTIQKPIENLRLPEGLNVKPEPLSGLKIHQDLRSHFVSPLQGLSEPFTFKPLKPISRADIIEQIGDISKGKIPSVAALVALLLAGRKSDVKEPVGKAIENVIKAPRLEPNLRAVLGEMKQPQKDKLVEIATKVKEGKTDNLGSKDFDIAKRIQQLQPQQIDALIAWGQNKSPIKFDILPADFQTKLSSILEHVVKATVGIKTEKAPVVADKTPAVDKTLPGDKTAVVSEKTVPSLKTIKPIEEPKTETKTIDVRQVAESETDKTAKISDSDELPDLEDDETKPLREKTRKTGTLYGLDGPPKRRTKQMQERDTAEAIEHKPPASTLLADTVRRLEHGSLDSDEYLIILQTLVKGEWKNVLECAVKCDEALYIQYFMHKSMSKQSMNGTQIISNIIQNNFFKNWQARINDYFGAK